MHADGDIHAAAAVAAPHSAMPKRTTRTA
jgi:hypothetical protein